MFKKLGFTFALVLGMYATSFSQTINGKPLKDIDVEFVEIVGQAKMLSNKLTIRIDFGQSSKYFSLGKEFQLKDKDGKKVVFNSMIDALNFMSKNGYNFVNAYIVTVNNQNVYHYILQKKERNK